jgi:hypothetical protein
MTMLTLLHATAFAAAPRHCLARPLLAAALVLAGSAPAGATPGPVLGCGGTFGIGGCAPYTEVTQQTGGSGNTVHLYEYDPVPLDVSSTGTFGLLRGQADLRNGELKFDGRSFDDGNPSIGSGVQVSVGASDVFTLTGVPTVGAFVQFAIILTADGVGASDLEGNGGHVLLQFGGPSLVIGPSDVPYDLEFYQAGVNGIPLFTDYPIHLLATANAVMPIDQPFQVDTMLSGSISEASYMDLSHTAQLRFVLPPGVSITSMGGYTTVPEPAATALLVAVLAVMLGLAGWRRRVSRVQLTSTTCPRNQGQARVDL